MNAVGVQVKTQVKTRVKTAGAPDLAMLPAVLRRGSILFVVRDGEPVRCLQDMSNVEPGEKVYHARQLSGG